MASKSWYQIDRIDSETGRPDAEYEMQFATSAKQALADYLTDMGYVLDDDMAPATIARESINGSRKMTARCPKDTSDCWTAVKAR